MCTTFLCRQQGIKLRLLSTTLGGKHGAESCVFYLFFPSSRRKPHWSPRIWNRTQQPGHIVEGKKSPLQTPLSPLCLIVDRCAQKKNVQELFFRCHDEQQLFSFHQKTGVEVGTEGIRFKMPLWVWKTLT